ncbi:uncharacterized protein DUF488 [Comamonas sp. BIGb0124]|uniref:DUF488 domain-containing protein n=1 Tax=Comamonas sp. BIGb0124 TaxID=2485130 RepID=UPI000F465307|nr:DUF488 domain-containing protein [Comamonas sp. BIGb0124]ROR25176.1 uncharacterized protein DUF488 [Comamonas sp. BIGb0124]
MDIYTIGFTKKSAEKFFSLIAKSGVKRVVDVRLNNVSQLAGFAKRDDLAYFLEKICGVSYIHQPLLAPTQSMLDEYKKNGGNWITYESRFIDLMATRQIEKEIPREVIDDGCLLCSEDKPHHCHRRVVAEYFKKHWCEDVKISHLG